ncbi:MAG TPA: VWA domain-containing protein [Acidobacteriaceae bacterium]|nr:VWA domain-containing protein [Acidobacteriaceae bacterium]
MTFRSCIAAFALTTFLASASLAQQTPAPPPTPADQNAPEAGGPGSDPNGIALPKKKDKSEEPAAPAAPVVKNPPELANYSIHVDVPVVNVNVSVLLDKNHQFVQGLKPENFRVLEDGVPQRISDFRIIQAPITAVLLLEFASNSYYFVRDMQDAAYSFAQQLKPDDYIAVATYDMRTRLLTDFTKDKSVVQQSLYSLQIPGMSETNEFDALYETLDRLTKVEGHKYIILISTGRDTFSRINLDKTLQKIRNTPDVTIFAIGTGQTARILAEGRGMGPLRELDYLQADNQMNTFARMTGGLAFFPRFPGEMPDIFHRINDSIRNQYLISYRPTNAKNDGTYRKLKIDLVDNEGKPLRMQDEKNKPLKYSVVARDGYKAKQQVE